MIFWILDQFLQKIKCFAQKSEKVLLLHLFPSLSIFSKIFFHRCYSNHPMDIIQKYFNVKHIFARVTGKNVFLRFSECPQSRNKKKLRSYSKPPPPQPHPPLLNYFSASHMVHVGLLYV